MPRNNTKHQIKVYYKNKLVGKCTVADKDAFEALMEDCNYIAKRVLNKYAYFSIELRTMLEKVAELQEKECLTTR